MQTKYFQKFPEAHQHMAIPPIGKTHNDVNELLQKLSRFTETNFISTKALRDNQTGRIRPDLMKGIHYNNDGIKPVAYALMKSLYSSANRENNKLKTLNEEMENDMPSDMETEASTEATPILVLEAISTQTE